MSDALRELRLCAKARVSAAEQERHALERMNRLVREARANGASAIQIAEAIGTTRQRVYEILRDSPLE